MTKKTIFAMMAVATMMTACATGSKTEGGQLNGEWNVKTINGQDLNTPNGLETPFLGFRGTDLYGSLSCNRLTGQIQMDTKKGTIDFSQTGSTRMMCHDMNTEQRMLNALGRAKKYNIKGNVLTLTDAKGKAVMVLNKK